MATATSNTLMFAIAVQKTVGDVPVYVQVLYSQHPKDTDIKIQSAELKWDVYAYIWKRGVLLSVRCKWNMKHPEKIQLHAATHSSTV